MKRGAWLATLLSLAGAGCEGELSHPPVARLAMDPQYVREGDAFVTTITLSGKTSADPFDDPTGKQKLTFRWTLPEGARVKTGSVSAADLTIALAGDRPAPITLEVTDEDGVTGSATKVIGIFKP